MKTSPEFEAFLARVYVDADFRSRFLAEPAGEAKRSIMFLSRQVMG